MLMSRVDGLVSRVGSGSEIGAFILHLFICTVRENMHCHTLHALDHLTRVKHQLKVGLPPFVLSGRVLALEIGEFHSRGNHQRCGYESMTREQMITR
jgi:hypothetical protein